MKTQKMILLLLLVSECVQAQSFIQRDGTHLTLDGKVFRYSGPNIEWLGLEGYGPHDPSGPRFPSRFEIEDALATAAEMGAGVVRSQTMGDTVGCALCIEPEQGRFNDTAFQASDYALAVAAKLHIRLIIPLIGDCATCSGGGIGQYLAWNHQSNPQAFFTDPNIIEAFEHHIDAILDHRNSITGARYRDDPTIMAWENCNICGLVTMLSHGDEAQVSKWSEMIGRHIKQLDHRHLYLDSSGIFRSYGSIVDNPTTDIVSFEEYPHWDAAFGIPLGFSPTTVETFSRDASAVTSHGKVFVVNEFGWDRTNWKSPSDLQRLLDTMVEDRNVSGDGFWALQAHLDNFGFQAIPADSHNPKFAVEGRGVWGMVGALLSRHQHAGDVCSGNGDPCSAIAQPRLRDVRQTSTRTRRSARSCNHIRCRWWPDCVAGLCRCHPILDQAFGRIVESLADNLQ